CTIISNEIPFCEGFEMCCQLIPSFVERLISLFAVEMIFLFESTTRHCAYVSEVSRTGDQLLPASGETEINPDEATKLPFGAMVTASTYERGTETVVQGLIPGFDAKK